MKPSIIPSFINSFYDPLLSFSYKLKEVSKILTKDNRIIKAGIASVFFMVLLVSWFYDPVKYKITDCAFKDMSGLSCPGCGLSRSFHAVANANIIDAFGFHLLGPLFFLLLLFVSILFSYEAISGKRIKLSWGKLTKKVIVILVFASWFLYWVARMTMEFFG